MFETGIILITGFSISEIVLIIAILIYRSNIQETINKVGKSEKNLIGNWYGGTFYAQPFFPILVRVKDETTMKYIKKHNRFIVFFYINFLILLFGILFLNLSEN
jgi:hypothetical protein